MNKYCDTKSWIVELVDIECEFSKILILSKTDFCNGNLIEFGVFFCKQKLHNALFRLDYSFQVCFQSNKFSAAGKRWTSKLKILLWQMPNLMKNTIIQIISEGSFKFLSNVCTYIWWYVLVKNFFLTFNISWSLFFGSRSGMYRSS